MRSHSATRLPTRGEKYYAKI